MGIAKAHWVTVVVMTGSLLLGVIIAIIHDQIYRHFNLKIVETTSQQEWLGRFGTASAFLVKTLFSTSIGSACVQRLWWTLRNKAISISTIDSSLSIAKNPFDLTNYRLFREVPLIVLLAILSWYKLIFGSSMAMLIVSRLVPIAALFAPPTLTVLQNAANSTSIQQHRVPAINFSAPFDVLGGKTSPHFYSGPQPLLERMGLEVALTSRPLTFAAPGSFSNASYNTQFWGPYFACENANQTMYDLVNTTTVGLGDSPLMFAAWTPYSDSDPGVPTDLMQWVTGSGRLSTVDTHSKDSAGLFVAALDYSFASDIPILQSMSVYECRLSNASYSLTFEFTNGFGAYSIRNMSMANPVAYPGSPLASPAVSYISMLDSLGQVLFGAIRMNSDSEIIVRETSVLKTSFATTKDFPSSLNFQGGQRSATLGSAIEELMVNMTVSLFSSNQYM
jgi:hypothetical protein